jgi:hypothetical protein
MITRSLMVRRIFAALASFALLTAVVGMIRLKAYAETPLFADIHIDVDLLRAGAGLDPEFEFDFAREAAFISGPTIVGAALKRPAIAKLETIKGRGADAVRWVSRQIHVEFPAPNLVRIRHVGERSHEAARLVNAIASVYVDEMIEETTRARAERIELLQRARCDTTKRLGEKREAIRRLEELLSSAHELRTAGANPHPAQLPVWARELETLRLAVEEGDEMLVRITADLAKLQIAPLRPAVELRRPATCSPVTP